jgi:NAD(P)-dependent dehydrogenase (short-subunit alcohol dehydrogenase family)
MGFLEGKTVLVAGVGPGLGREVAAAAIREGARVVAVARNQERLQGIASKLDASGRRLRTVVGDITRLPDCHSMVEEATKLGPLDGLVVVGALDTIFGGIEGADWEAWHRAMEVNFFGPMHLTAAALPAFSDSGASVVYITTQTIYHPPSAVLQAAYAGSKAALLGASRHLAIELGRRSIRVNTVAPGWMYGPAVEGYVQSTARATGSTPEEVKASITRNFALGEMATDGDVAEAVVFLLSSRSRAITGQALLVNAGEYLH